MKKFLSSVSLAALAFCFTLQTSHAMEQDAEPQQGMKRLLPVNQEGNPEIPLPNGISFSTPSITSHHFNDILIPYTSLHPNTDIIWDHRRVNKEWENALNLHVKKLDLCPRLAYRRERDTDPS